MKADSDPPPPNPVLPEKLPRGPLATHHLFVYAMTPSTGSRAPAIIILDRFCSRQSSTTRRNVICAACNVGDKSKSR